MAGYSVTFTVVDQATRQIDQINRRIQQMRAPMERQARVMQRFVDVTGLRSMATGFGSIASKAGAAFSSVSRLVPAMGAITAAGTVAGMFRLTQSWADLGTKLQDIGAQTGIAANDVEHLQNVARVAGGNVDDMTQSLIGLSNKLYDAQLARDPTAVAAFNKLGVAIRDTNGRFRTTQEVLPDLLRALDNVADPADRMRLAVATGGDSLFRLTNEIERARRPGENLTETWRRLNEQARSYDQNIDAGKLQAYREAIGQLDATFNSLKIQLGTTLSTALVPLINEFGMWVNTHQPQIIKAVEAVLGIFKGLIGILGGGEGDTSGVGGVVGAVALVAAAFGPIKFAAGIINSVASITNAIGAVGSLTATGGIVGGIGLLGALGGVVILSLEIIRHWDEIRQAGTQMVESLSSGWERLKNSISDTSSLMKGFRGEGVTPAETAPAPTGPPGPPRPTGRENVFTGGMYGAAGHEEFLAQAWPLAQREAARTGLDPRLIIAQAALESGWGKSRRAREQGNYFGIKGAGPGGRDFATHGNMAESFRAYGDLMLAERYKKVREAQGLEAQVAALGASPYTPDIGYAPQIGAIAGGLAQPGAGGGDRSAVAKGVNAALTGALTQAFGVLPAGYTAALTSGVRRGDPRSQHYTGSALDFQISGPQGAISNRGEDVTGLYRQVQVATLANLMQSNPELAKQFGSGFAFETSQGSGVRDIMHVDVGGARGGLEDPYAIHREAAALLASSQGAPREVTGGAPVTGAVDVNITHRNPPAGTTLTATSTGDVNVPPPRTEQQQFAFA